MTSEENTGNGLNLINKKSKTVPIEEFEFNDIELKVKEYFKDNGLFIVYLDYKVIIGKYESSEFLTCDNEKFDPKFIQKIRVFNNDKELLLYISEGKLKGRIRTDDEGTTDCDIIEAKQVLFGRKYPENYSPSASSTIITEVRGTTLVLPFKVTNIDKKKENRVKIKTRNYIGYNKNNQAGYVDCRFVEFTFGIDNKAIGGK